MPVWHVSVARMSRTFERIIPVAEWPPNVMRQARDVQHRTLTGVGGTWMLEEIGETALHLRRRLSREEMRLLFRDHPSCPVFTHGSAMAEVLS